MTNINNKEKLTKIELIDSINMHYFKKGVLCENLNKISKTKLLEIYIDNKIEYVDKEQLKKEIIATEKYNHLRDIIHCNFIKYENIKAEIQSYSTLEKDVIIENDNKNAVMQANEFLDFKLEE